MTCGLNEISSPQDVLQISSYTGTTHTHVCKNKFSDKFPKNHFEKMRRGFIDVTKIHLLGGSPLYLDFKNYISM